MDAKMLAKFVAKYGEKGLDLIAKHPGKAAGAAGAGLAAAGIGGAIAGKDATIHAIPGEILKRLGLDNAVGDSQEAYSDAMEYAKKHPVAGGLIGMSAMKGADPYLQKILAMLGAGGDDGQQP